MVAVAATFLAGCFVAIAMIAFSRRPTTTVPPFNSRSQAESGGTPNFVSRGSADQIDLAAASPRELIARAAANDSLAARSLKRLFDVAAALGLLIAAAPLLAVTAAAIAADTPGGVFYRQRRVGLNGRVFEIFKFRSMVRDAERDGARWAAKNDLRVTRVGKVIRKLRIDEIPQVINVLRGEMSFVGPRPERPEFVELLEREIPHYHLRHLVKPGITGWAQVKYVYGASVEDARRKLQFDLHYIKHFSVFMDLLIVFLTIRVALFGVGSR